MSQPAPIEGFWSREVSKTPHYFLPDSPVSVCGRATIIVLSGIDGMPRSRDCKTCAEIYHEIHAAKLPAAQEADWSVKSDLDLHILFFQRKEQQRGRGNHKLKALQSLCEHFNARGTKPASKCRRCAADHPSPENFLTRKSRHSPPLPLL